MDRQFPFYDWCQHLRMVSDCYAQACVNHVRGGEHELADRTAEMAYLHNAWALTAISALARPTKERVNASWTADSMRS